MEPNELAAVPGGAETTEANASHRHAKAVLVLGLCSLGLPIVLSVPAIVFGGFALRRIVRSRGRLPGKAPAATGLLLGFLTLGAGFAVGIPKFQSIQRSARVQQCQDDLERIGRGLHNYHGHHGWFPTRATWSKDEKPLLSWRVCILPFVGEKTLYREFHHDEPWDSPQNLTLLEKMPRLYGHPLAPPNEIPAGITHYLAPVPMWAEGETRDPAALGAKVATRLSRHFSRGTSSTIMVVETAKGVAWTKPEDAEIRKEMQGADYNGLFGGGFFALRVDGKAVFLDASRWNLDRLQSCMQRVRGELIPNWMNDEE
jgi:hypothetical protein